jgi:hypothetical protein
VHGAAGTLDECTQRRQLRIAGIAHDHRLHHALAALFAFPPVRQGGAVARVHGGRQVAGELAVGLAVLGGTHVGREAGRQQQRGHQQAQALLQAPAFDQHDERGQHGHSSFLPNGRPGVERLGAIIRNAGPFGGFSHLET